MNTKTRTIIGIIIFATFLGIAYFAYLNLADNYRQNNEKLLAENSSKESEEKLQAPDFTVIDASGKKVKLSDFKGKPVVLNFWASWCPPCKLEMPHFNDAYAEVKDKVVFMMVDLVDGQRETKEKGQKYITDQGYTFPIYFDIEQDAAYSYRISSIPMTFFIDSDGNVVSVYQGAISKKDLKAAIDLIRE